MNADRTVLTDDMWARTETMLPGKAADPLCSRAETTVSTGGSAVPQQPVSVVVSGKANCPATHALACQAAVASGGVRSSRPRNRVSGPKWRPQDMALCIADQHMRERCVDGDGGHLCTR